MNVRSAFGEYGTKGLSNPRFVTGRLKFSLYELTNVVRELGEGGDAEKARVRGIWTTSSPLEFRTTLEPGTRRDFRKFGDTVTGSFSSLGGERGEREGVEGVDCIVHQTSWLYSLEDMFDPIAIAEELQKWKADEEARWRADLMLQADYMLNRFAAAWAEKKAGLRVLCLHFVAHHSITYPPPFFPHISHLFMQPLKLK